MSAARVLAVAAAAGFVGWALENGLDRPRYSQVFGVGNKIPFLPVYAAGGALLAVLVPHAQGAPWALRVAAYGAALTALEAVAGVAERHDGRASWDYGGSPVDLPHALAWTALAALAEPAILSATRP